MTMAFSFFRRKKNLANRWNRPDFKKGQKKFYQKNWFKITATIVIVFLFLGGCAAFRAAHTLNVISDSDSSALGSVWGLLSGGNIAEGDDGRINILLLGMRGEDLPGGGLLADSIMLISFQPEESRYAIISIPRDLYVKIPGTENHSKINAVYAYGEQSGKKQGFEQMKKAVGEVTGLKIQHAASINFAGFKQLIDAVGGVTVNLEAPFYELNQFVEGDECGGKFVLPEGENLLDGEVALCYVRARENTSDFDRSKRQQLVLEALKDKLISLGTLTSFSKVNAILEAVGENVRTDLSSSQMKRFYDEYSSVQGTQVYRRVFENSEEGLLTAPDDKPEGVGYILVPRAGWEDYSEIQQVCRDIFDLPPQSDINPVKQDGAENISAQDMQNSISNDGDEEEEPTQKVKIKLTGELQVEDGVKYTIDQQIKEVIIEGEDSEDELKLDLGKITNDQTDNRFSVRVEEVEEILGIKIVSHDNRDKVLIVELEKD